MVLPEGFSAQLVALKAKKCLVTGGSGFVGRHIVELLLEVGSQVTVFDVIEPKPEDRLPTVTYIKGDLLSAESVRAAVAGKFVVFHVASPSPLSKNAELFFNVNVNGLLCD